MNKTSTLRRKLLTWLLLPMLTLWLISAAVMYTLAFKFVNYAYDYSLMDSTHDLEGQIATVGGKASLNLPKSALQMFLSDELDEIHYNVVGRNGEILGGDPELPMPEDTGRPGISSVRNATFRGKKVRIASLSLLPPGLPPDKSVLIQVAETLNKRNMLARKVITAMVVPQFLMVMLAALIVWIGIAKGLSPLESLHREIAVRSHKDLRPIEESDIPQEVRPIIHEINRLMERLHKALEAQMRFVADAAHQLRTPLAGLKTQTSLALRQSDPVTLQHSLNQLNISADRTIRLINQMLVLAQVEPDSGKIFDLKPLDLGKIVKEATKEWVPPALKKGIDLGYEGPDNAIMINGDTVLIRTIIDNLIDNAIKYSPNGSSVTTRVKEVEGSVALTVEDNGSGIPPLEREAVFQRFYRISDNPMAGSGLGLSIVKEIAMAHGARVSLEDPQGQQGIAVRVIFPRTA